MRFPLRSPTDLMGELAGTSSARLAGGPYMAATATAGTPLTRNPIPGPEPRPTSMLPAVSACCICASPRKADSSSSIPSCSKILASEPTSATAKANELGTALPSFTLSSACAAALENMSAAATSKVRRNRSRINDIPVHAPRFQMNERLADLSGGPGEHQCPRARAPAPAAIEPRLEKARRASKQGRNLRQAHGPGNAADFPLLVLAHAHDERTGGPVEPLRLGRTDGHLLAACLLRDELPRDLAQL